MKTLIALGFYAITGIIVMILVALSKGINGVVLTSGCAAIVAISTCIITNRVDKQRWIK